MSALWLIVDGPEPRLAGEEWSALFADFVTRCCQKLVTCRPSASTLLHDPFIMQHMENPDSLKELLSMRPLTARSLPGSSEECYSSEERAPVQVGESIVSFESNRDSSLAPRTRSPCNSSQEDRAHVVQLLRQRPARATAPLKTANSTPHTAGQQASAHPSPLPLSLSLSQDGRHSEDNTLDSNQPPSPHFGVIAARLDGQDEANGAVEQKIAALQQRIDLFEESVFALLDQVHLQSSGSISNWTNGRRSMAHSANFSTLSMGAVMGSASSSSNSSNGSQPVPATPLWKLWVKVIQRGGRHCEEDEIPLDLRADITVHELKKVIQAAPDLALSDAPLARVLLNSEDGVRLQPRHTVRSCVESDGLVLISLLAPPPQTPVSIPADDVGEQSTTPPTSPSHSP